MRNLRSFPAVLQTRPKILLLLLTLAIAHIIPKSCANETINGTLHYLISPSLNFDYELSLAHYQTGEEDSTMKFLWKAEKVDDSKNMFYNTRHKQHPKRKYSCRIIHKTTTPSNVPSWIGFGVQDAQKLESGIGRDKMLGAETIIGFSNPNDGEKPVKTYALKGLYEGSGGVEETLSSEDRDHSIYDLSESRVQNIESEIEDGQQQQQTTISTIFDFVIIKEEDDDDDNGITRHENENSKFKIKGENLFIFAIGPSESFVSSNKIGKHVKAGSFVVDFDKVGTSIERSYINQPINCNSDDLEYDLMMLLQSNVKFYWTLDTNNDLLHVQMKHLGQAWLGWGIADDAEGKMIGTNAVIGRPALTAADGEVPLKYFLSKKEQGGIYPLPQNKQTLIGASLTQNDEETVLRFTKKLDETDENVISKTNMTTIIFAIGEGNIMTKHKFSDSFSLALHSCPLEVHEVVDKVVYKTAWTFHGIFGTMAFALFLPISVSSAFLRQLLPTSWIYLHAYGNLLTLAFTLICAFIAITTFSSSGNSHFTESHHKIGLSLLILASIQVLNGLLRPNPFEEKQRRLWIVFHRVLGTAILCLGLFQVGDGLNMFAEDYNSVNLAPLYFVALAIFTVIIFGAKLWLFVHGAEERRFGDHNEDLETERLGKLDPPETELT